MATLSNVITIKLDDEVGLLLQEAITSIKELHAELVKIREDIAEMKAALEPERPEWEE